MEMREKGGQHQSSVRGWHGLMLLDVLKCRGPTYN